MDAAASGGALYGNVSEEVGVSGSAITGVVDVPAGATVKLVNATSDQTIGLPSGPFTIDTGQTTSAEGLNTSDESVRRHARGGTARDASVLTFADPGRR